MALHVHICACNNVNASDGLVPARCVSRGYTGPSTLEGKMRVTTL
jgi:hypothetical protein